jgi:3-hydroxyacyl-CoA dehydrogenase
MHFFNPPRYLHLLEIIPTAETTRETIDAARRFSDRILGKGIVVAKDVPGFVANRLGVFGVVLAIRLMERHGLTIDEADVLTGVLTGRSKSATYRTADLSGIDVIAHVTKGLNETTGEDFALSSWVMDLVKKGQVGEKSGAGFYKRVGKEIHTLDWKTGEYRPQVKPDTPELARLTRLPLAERFASLRLWADREGDFVKEYLLRFSHYVLTTTPAIAYDIPSVDHAIEWGYAWEAGPFKQMDMLGVDFLRRGFAELGLNEPALLREVREGFYSSDGMQVLSLSGGYQEVPHEAGEIRLADFHADQPSARSRRTRRTRRARDRERRASHVHGRRGSVDGAQAHSGQRLEEARGRRSHLSGHVAAHSLFAVPGGCRALWSHPWRWVRVFIARGSGAGALRAVHGASGSRHRVDSGRWRNHRAPLSLCGRGSLVLRR